MAVVDRASTLGEVWAKVEANERLDLEDGLALLETDDLLELGALADLARRKRGGTDDVYFVQNLYLTQTNVCRVKCKFCAFAATQKQEHAYTLTTQELVDDALKQRELTGFTEIHMVNGENPHVGLDFYVETIGALKAAMPDVHLKCYTASEIHHMTTISGLSHEQVLRELQAAGLGSLPGGGAEVFSPRARQLIAPGKEPGSQWLETHRIAHSLGMPTHATLLYGHVETYEERIDHMLQLRALQDETHGFLAFIPLAFHPENTVFERRGWKHTTGADDLKMMAVGRLMLDNFDHIKAYWIMMGMPLSAVALHFGANDVQGTVVRETIFHSAGAVTETEQKIDQLVRFVREAGRIPVQRDTLYNEVRAVGRVSVKLGATIPALPCADVERSVVFYRDRLGFGLVHQEESFASLHRDEATVHLWGASDEGWRTGLDAMRPVRSGAESFIAGTASCRIAVEGIDELFESCEAQEIVHPDGAPQEKPWGSREFTVTDPDGNAVTFFQ